MRHVAIPQLQCETPLKGLPITWSSLGLDTVPPPGAEHDGVPRASILRVREWHFGAKPEGRVQANPQPFEERRMCPVAQGLA